MLKKSRFLHQLKMDQLMPIIIACVIGGSQFVASQPMGRDISSVVGACTGGDQQSSLLCDPDKLLTPTQEHMLSGQLNAIKTNTKCPCSVDACRKNANGFEVHVVVIAKMIQSPVITDSSKSAFASQMDSTLQSARQFATSLLQKWAGRCDEVTVMFYSYNESVSYTVTGVTAGKVLTSDIIGEIAMDSRLDFSQNTTTGFQTVLSKYQLVFQGNYNRTTFWGDGHYPFAAPVVGSGSSSFSIWTSFFGMSFLVVLSFLSR